MEVSGRGDSGGEVLSWSSFPGSGVRVLGCRKKALSLNLYPKPVRCKWPVTQGEREVPLLSNLP